MKFHTKVVSFDPAPGDPFRPTVTPIYQTATFEQESPLEFGRYDYSRSGNPTRHALEAHVARLEHAHRAFALPSGLAAITAVTRLLRPGEEILAGDDLYGGAFRLFSRILADRGVSVRYADPSDPLAFAARVAERTRLVYLETPTNPLLNVSDLRAIARASRAANPRALVVVDNSFLSPYLQNPLDLGADVVVHSATKLLCGHSDVSAGLVCVNDPDLSDELALIHNGEGAVLGPQDSFLLLRGLKTLALRLDRQQASAQRIASYLNDHPRVTRVRFRGLHGDAADAVHAAQARGPGCVVCFETGCHEASVRLLRALRLFPITVSFGGIGSSASLPASMSHASIPPALRARHAPPSDLIRLSIGIEDPGDLIEDLAQALDAAFAPRATQPLETTCA